MSRGAARRLRGIRRRDVVFLPAACTLPEARPRRTRLRFFCSCAFFFVDAADAAFGFRVLDMLFFFFGTACLVARTRFFLGAVLDFFVRTDGRFFGTAFLRAGFATRLFFFFTALVLPDFFVGEELFFFDTAFLRRDGEAFRVDWTAFRAMFIPTLIFGVLLYLKIRFLLIIRLTG